MVRLLQFAASDGPRRTRCGRKDRSGDVDWRNSVGPSAMTVFAAGGRVARSAVLPQRRLDVLDFVGRAFEGQGPSPC